MSKEAFQFFDNLDGFMNEQTIALDALKTIVDQNGLSEQEQQTQDERILHGEAGTI